MKGFNEFIKLFGNITVANLIEIILAIGFLFLLYKKASGYLAKVYEREKKRENDMNSVIEAVGKYPTYREQSLKIQEELKNEISNLKRNQEETIKRVTEMESSLKKRECNRLRDILIQNYRHYTNKETNPSGTWTEMESEAFWDLFEDYEATGGDGYMHTEVMPAMEKLLVVRIKD